MSATLADEAHAYFKALHARLTRTLETLDGKKTFLHETWARPDGGGGETCVLEDGALFEKAGVNFSDVRGSELPKSASARHPELAGKPYRALGVSLVLHPENPYVPTAHMNVRMFFTDTLWWFGGGFDLTPYYPFDEDARHWHATAKAACDPFGADVYTRFKQACDTYFYLPHRGETRGVGGLFFDDLGRSADQDFARCFAITQSVGDHFLPAYLPIAERRRGHTFAAREREFQAYRRGRYVEFNLVFDRGTLFGLQSGGRTESILMSLPPIVRWRYGFAPERGSPEARLEEYLRPREWI